MELFKASSQWSQRPIDERFASLEDLHRHCKQYHDTAAEKDVPFADLRVEADGADVLLLGTGRAPARLTHWAFGQLASHVGAPASYLRELPATLACHNLNHGLAKRVKEATGSALAKLLFHTNGSLLLRAITSGQYSRIWNYEIAERLLDMQANGWEPAKPTMAWGKDPSVCILCEGTGRADGIGERGTLDTAGERCVQCRGTGKAQPALYASDHDLFAFVINKQAMIEDPENHTPLYRGMIWENSEVGASKLRGTRFYFAEICGNHIIWGARNVVEISLRHVGDVRERYGAFAVQMKEYANESASEDQAQISLLRYKLIASSKEDVLDALFGKRTVGLSMRTLEAGYEAVKPEDGDARTPWGIAQGLTRYSQTIPYADKRMEVDRAAGRILSMF